MLEPQARPCRSRTQHPPKNSKLRISVAGGRGVPGSDQAVDQRFILGIKFVIKSAELLAPLRFDTRSGVHRYHQPVVEHPVERELACGHAALFGMCLDALRMFEQA